MVHRLSSITLPRWQNVVFVVAAIFSHPILLSEIPATATDTVAILLFPRTSRDRSLFSYTDPQSSRCVGYWQRANHTYAGNPPVRIWEKIPPVACAATAWISPWSNRLAGKRAKLARRTCALPSYAGVMASTREEPCGLAGAVTWHARAGPAADLPRIPRRA
jgi:hypothetical protein